MAAVLCLDFDDTLVMENCTRAIFERFAAPGWRELEARYHGGELSVEQYNAAALNLVEAEPADVRAFVLETCEPRRGIRELVDWAQWHGWIVAVVSNSFDLAVDPILDRLGFDRVARHAGRARKEYRWRVRYDSPRGVELQAGFKLAYVAAFKGTGDFVAYAGDGESDVEAARLADVVFARDTLWARLRDDHPRIYPFETFHDVIAVLDREAENWLASFSSTTAEGG